MSEPIHIISLGAGVQSSTMALMAAAGEITPMPICSVFCDTGDEPSAVYEWIKWLKPNLPFGIVEVSRGRLSDEQLRIREHLGRPGKFWAKSLIPAFILNPDGTKGIMGRQCTFSYKVEMLEKQARRIVERGLPQIRPWQRKHKNAMTAWRDAKKAKVACPAWAWDEMQADALAVQWIGISLDEVQRMKPARHPWIRHRWPLIEKEMTRHDCLRWMEAKKFPVPPRSACVYCPFHSDAEWRRLAKNDPDGYKFAIEFEKKLQAVKAKTDNIKGVPFLHSSLKPLGEVVFTTDTERGQGLLAGFNNECEGMCGV